LHGCHAMALHELLQGPKARLETTHELFLIRSMTFMYSASEHMSTSCLRHNPRSMLKCSTCEDHDASCFTSENLGAARAQAAISTRYGQPSVPLMHRIMSLTTCALPWDGGPGGPALEAWSASPAASAAVRPVSGAQP